MKKFIAVMIASLGLIASPSIAFAQAPELNICTGGTQGKYHQTALELRKQLTGAVSINSVNTNGSLDNLRQLEAGTCDAAIVQSDAYGFYVHTNPSAKLNFQRVAPLYNEYANLVCNRNSGVEWVGDLLRDGRTVMIGPAGSGTAVTWQTWAKQNPDYAKVSTLPDAGTIAIGKAVDATEAQCFLFISGLGAGSMNQANELGAGTLKLVKVDDGSFDDVLDPKNQRVYAFADIPGGTYPELQNFGMFGGQSNVTTITLGAVLVVNQSWVEANTNGMNDLTAAALRWAQQNRN